MEPSPDRLIPDIARPILGRDFAYFRAEFTTEGGSVVEFGEYLMINRTGTWEFAFPHLREELERRSARIRKQKGTMVMRQFNPPLPEDENEPITITMNDYEEEVL